MSFDDQMTNEEIIEMLVEAEYSSSDSEEDLVLEEDVDELPKDEESMIGSYVLRDGETLLARGGEDENFLDSSCDEAEEALQRGFSPLTPRGGSPMASEPASLGGSPRPSAALRDTVVAQPGPSRDVGADIPRGGSPQPSGSGTGRTVRGLVVRRASASRQGRGGGRGRRFGRGRNRVSSGVRGMDVRSEWSRGEPLLERFATDEELPATLRETFERLTTVRDRREQTTRARRAANLELQESESDEDEIAYFDNEEFVWMPMDGWNGVKETFLGETPGPVRRFENEYDAFRSFWSDDLLSHITTETNRHAQGISSERFRRDWYETNNDEIMVLFAFWMMLGILKLPTIKSCFTTKPLLRTEVFRRMFAESRYWNINRAFHLVNGSRRANDPHNLLYPMGPLLDELNSSFQRNYTLQQDICIDESLTLWKDPAGFKQYIRTKSARFGIKTYQLCESSTGYLWSFFVYVGAQTSTSTMPSSVSTVVKLVKPLLNKGHVLYMDNWFNSPMLARYLKRRRTDCVGTLRSFRRNVPAVVQQAPLAEGEFVARQAGDVMVIALEDRKRLTCISTFHGLDQVEKVAKPGRSSKFKLKLVDDYNYGMGGVDRLDQMLEPYLIERKQCAEWSRKLFKRLLNITIQNARILLEKSSNTKLSSLPFRIALVQSILDHHLRRVPRRTEKPRPAPRVTYPQFPEERLTGRHFMRRNEVTDEMRATIKHSVNWGRRQCVWCTARAPKPKRTYFGCPECNVPLCVECFEPFHTIP